MDQCQRDPDTMTLGEIRDLFKGIGPCPYCSSTHAPLLVLSSELPKRHCYMCNMEYYIEYLGVPWRYDLCYADGQENCRLATFDYCVVPHWDRDKDGKKC